MSPGSRNLVAWAAVALVAAVALFISGSFVYWLTDGQPGTPDDFRQRVTDTGLNVAWSNSGPRGGSGVVDTACGPVDVTVSDIDDRLWLRWADRHEPATREVVAALHACAR